jgi:putative nucleotidyltransferase with HDIG domain
MRDDAADNLVFRPADRRSDPREPDSDRRDDERIDPIERAHHDAIFTFARAAEADDEDTGSHLIRIRLIVQHLAEAMGLEDAEPIGYDAMLHDVGKMMIPHEILKKPGPLTDPERRVMEAHTIAGERMLSNRASMRRASRIARSHHECWDGSGYPDGLRGEAIPIEARITTVADILDALIASRCYKRSWTYDEAVEAVCGMGGSKLDPDVVGALRRCHDTGVLRDVLIVRLPYPITE